MKKRGMSAVISNLIIILLVIVAVGIVWSVVQGLIEDTQEQINLDNFDVEAGIKDTTITDDLIEVQVENTGGKSMPGVKIIIYDEKGDTTPFIRDSSIASQGIKTFELEYLGIVTGVGVEPRIEKEGEIINSKQITETKEFSNKRVLTTLGASSWFKLDGDTNNEIKGGKGNLNGDIVCKEKGKYGQACEFFGEDDYIEVEGLDSLGKAQAYWIYNNEDGEWDFYVNNSGTQYVNEEIDSSTDYGGLVSLSGGNLRIGGTNDISEGKIDEVMIFSEELNEQEVKGLYDLELITT